MSDLKATLRPAIVSLLAATVLLGLVYPMCMSGVAAVAFPHQANGSLIEDHGKVVGSELIGQPFDEPKYFWSRPSALTAYDAMTSSGTNAGPTGYDKAGRLTSNPALVDAVKARIKALRDADPGNTAPVPVDLITASGSGLDPQISPAAAYYQIDRVARARGVQVSAIRALVDDHIEERTFGVLGERRVNVLLLNRDLDRTLGKAP